MKSERQFDFRTASDIGIRYDVTIKPTEGGNPEYAVDLKNGLEKLPRVKKLMMIMVPDDDDPAELGVMMLGMSVNELSELLWKHKEEEGIVDVLAAAAIAEGHIRAMELTRAAKEKSLKGDLSNFLAEMVVDRMQRKQEQEGGE